MKRAQFLRALPWLGASILFHSTSAMAATTSATFEVSVTIQKACSVTAGAPSNISLGTVAATATNVLASNVITVLCSKTTPYYVGLAPSNGNTVGAGVMSGTGSNTDKVPYQLSSTAGPTGTVWGNISAPASSGNGVTGTGTGANQSLTVHVTAPSANYTPDSYTDTVTVTVTF